jgi:mevalonate kinase
MHERTTATSGTQLSVNKEKRTTTRKIGKCTFIVYSTFKEGRERDVVAVIARLIQNDNPTKPGA